MAFDANPFAANPLWKPGHPIVWHHRNPALRNQHCLYCNCFLGAGSDAKVTKEHLIGKRFVPTGSLDKGQRFNLLFSACEACNNRKARFEDHVSAVAMVWSPRGASDPSFHANMLRKAAESYHPLRPGFTVAESAEYPQIRAAFGGASIQMTFSAPPRLDARQVKMLAAMHVQALYALATTRDHRSADGLKRLHPSNIWFLAWYPVTDWGNPSLAQASQRIASRPPAITINAAEGAFRATLRRGAAEQHWCWALEWNHAVRIVGAIGDFDAPPTVLADIAQPRWQELPDGSRVRPEAPLTGDDFLFVETLPPDAPAEE